MSELDESDTAALLGQLKVEPGALARERAFAQLSDEFHATAAPAGASAHRRTTRWAIAAGVVVLLAASMTWQALQPGARVANLESLDGMLVTHGAHWFNANTQARAGDGLTAGESLTVSNDGGALLRLSPDLTVRLGAGTHARLGNAQEIELTAGVAFVDATPGARAPLRIVTPHGVVTHLGTQYLVRIERDAIELAVREGRAELKTGLVTSVAVAGEWLTQRDRDGVHTGKLPVDDPRFDWIAALPSEFRLDGATLNEFLAWFQRETGLSPTYGKGLDSAHLGQVQLKGSIESLEPLEALSLVLATADLAWRREGAKVIIEQRSTRTG